MNRILTETRKPKPDPQVLASATAEELLEETALGQSALRNAIGNRLLIHLPYQFNKNDRIKILNALFVICQEELSNPNNSPQIKQEIQKDLLTWQKRIHTASK